MKLSKMLSKRVLSLFIVGLFVFTAFAVIQSGGTDTASIHSVSSPTPILPYTTTSNGLTYTVESNGTYLWNGHYLRDPPVAYPKVPTTAPDGLPYGAVGSVGPQGQVGAKSFPKGTAQIIGVSPATTTGQATIINKNTVWGNETISLVGNVSIEGPYSLTIYNSVVTFTEPSGSFAYGFNVSSNNITGFLNVVHGSTIQSTGTNSWYIHTVSNQDYAQSAAFPSNPNGITFNSTNGDVYVAGPTNNITVLSPSLTVIKTIPVGTTPYTPAWDSLNGLLWVPNYNSNNISVVNPSTSAIVKTLTGVTNPTYALYDSQNNNVYVSNRESTYVSIFNATTYTESNISSVPGYLQSELFIPSVHTLWVFSSSVSEASLINTSTNVLEKTIKYNNDTTSGGEISTALDTINNTVYFTAYYGGSQPNIYVANGSSGLILANYSFPNINPTTEFYPMGLFFEQGSDLLVISTNNHDIYVADPSNLFKIKSLYFPGIDDVLNSQFSQNPFNGIVYAFTNNEHTVDAFILDQFTGVDFSNSWLISGSAVAPLSASHSFYVTYFNDSTYEGGTVKNISLALNITGGSQHSQFIGGIAEGFFQGNNSFNDSAVGVAAYSIFGNSGIINIYTPDTSVSINYTIIQNTSSSISPMFVVNCPSFWFISNGQSGGPNEDPVQFYVSHSSFKNINMTNPSNFDHELWASAPFGIRNYGNTGGEVDIQNNTFINIWAKDGGARTFFGTGENANLASYSVDNSTFNHNTIINVTSQDTGGNGNNGVNMIGTAVNGNIEYNRILGVHNLGGSEPNLFTAFGLNFNLSYNIFTNWTGNMGSPFYHAGPFGQDDDGTQNYNVVNGVYNVSTSNGLPSGISSPMQMKPGQFKNEYKNFNNNWFVNLSGQVWITQITGYGDHVYDNTIINMNNAGGVGVSVNSGANYATVANNTAYGVYNYSYVVGSNEDGAINTIYYGNTAQDIGIHSITELTYGSRNETWNDVNCQPILISNGNMSFNQVDTGLIPYIGHTTIVNLVNSAFSQVILAATPNGGNIYNRYVLPNDFNITIGNSYVPASWPVFDANNGSYYSIPVDPFSFSNGPYTLSAPYSNSYFLNLTGYLGIYSGQTYTLNASNIKNEASLPIYYSGNEIADVPASSAHYNFTALGVDKYSISTPSSKSDPVKLYFQGIADALYDVEMISNGTVVSTFTEYANATGVLNTTYNPSTMPLDPIFTVAYVGSGVVPPPVVTPLVPIVPHVLFGIPYLNVIVLFGGIALASEEFFRTQAKGNEKRYSYTGVFVGIMIAGIGLMIVL